MSDLDYCSDGVKLLHGDCLDRMKEIPDGSVDCVITSPPYNMNLRVRNGVYCSRQIVKELSTKYEGFADNMPMEDYFQFNKSVISECLRVSDLVFYNVQMVTGNKPALFRLLGEFNDKVKELIVWDKVNSQPAMKDGVLNSQFELIVVFQNSSPMNRMFDIRNFNRGTASNVWQIKRERSVDKTHGAVFPESLPSKVIEMFTREGAAILDPLMGTGTAGVAALKNGRDFIGIELSERYFKIAKERILNAKGQRQVQAKQGL